MKEKNNLDGKRTFLIQDRDLGEVEVALVIGRYESFSNLFVGLVSEHGLLAKLTANLAMPLPIDMAFVDTNNFPEALQFLEKNGFARDTGFVSQSGFCEFPLYQFNFKAMAEVAPGDVRDYLNSAPDDRVTIIRM